MLELKNLERSDRAGPSETWVLRNLKINLREGEFLTIMGPSGAGKSSLLNVRAELASSGWLVLMGGSLGLLGAVWLRPLLTHWIAASVVGADSAETGALFNRAAALLTSVGVLAVVAFFAAARPAWSAARVQPIEALRTE